MKPFIIKYGRYKGREIRRVVKEDLPYCLWELENTEDEKFREAIANLPDVIEHIRKLNDKLRKP